MIELDGKHGEGGGAILRQALALSMHTRKAFKITDIRGNRPQQGMKMQHLKALNAAQRLCNAKVKGNFKGSTEVTFEPDALKGQTLKIDIETAGSITLLLQSLLLPCVFSLQKFKFSIIGGTDVKWSQPVDYFENIFLPQLRKYADIDFEIEKRGYYPKGSGQIMIRIQGGGEPDKPIELVEQGELLQIKGVSHASRDLSDREVADRQARTAELVLSGLNHTSVRREYSNTKSTGSGVTLWAVFGDDDGVNFENPVLLGGDCLGEPKKKAELVGEEAAMALKKEIGSGAACDKYLADQLIPYMAVAGGSLNVSEVTKHSLSNIYVAEKFTERKFRIENNIIQTA